MNIQFIRKKGFTLAEVLITLVIIGVIAAMTIPTLMNNTNKQEYVSKLRKAYATLSQATNKIITDEGMPRGDIGGWVTSRTAVFNLYKKYLNVTKDCLTSSDCSIPDTDVINMTYAGYKLILSDGMVINISTNDTHCGLDHVQGTSNVCQYIDVDINGHKKPNKLGRDIFSFGLKEDGKLYPLGCEGDFCNSNNIYWLCTCKVLREGAINY